MKIQYFLGTSETSSLSRKNHFSCLWQEGHKAVHCDMLMWLHIRVHAVRYQALTVASGPFSPPYRVPPRAAAILSLAVSAVLSCSPTSLKDSPGHVQYVFFLCSNLPDASGSFPLCYSQWKHSRNGAAVSVVSLLHLLKYSAELFWDTVLLSSPGWPGTRCID